MDKNTTSSSNAGIWSQLVFTSAATGVLMGLFEVCWTYLLPVLFPNRRYELPISTVGRFVLIAIVIDVFLMLTAAIVLGVVIWVVRKIWRRGRSLRHWPTLGRFLLVAGALSYLYVSIVYSHYPLGSARMKLQAALIGIFPVILTSFLVVWLVGVLHRRIGKAAATMVWGFALVVLICMATPNYLIYRSANTVDMELPAFGTKDRPNVLFVTLDTLRADYLGCYGNKIVQTPVLDALAKDGFLFEAAFAQAPSTTPSHCSMMTSTYVVRNGAMNGRPMKAGLPTLAEIFQANGYKTSAFVSATTVQSTNSRLQHGFDYYEDSISPYTALLRNDEYQFVLLSYLFLRLQNKQIPGHIVSNRALPWLNKHVEGPFFLWLHYFDPHDPYDAPEPYKDMYSGKVTADLPCVLERSRYAGEVTYTDFELGRIIKALKDKGLYDDMLIIVTADHGEAFGEKHGDITEYNHGRYLYDTTQHVPLIIKLPGQRDVGQRFRDVVELIDLAPTVLDYLNTSLPKSFQGSSLLDLLNGQQRSTPGAAYSERIFRLQLDQFTQRPKLMAIRTADIKYICEPDGERQELYNVVSDPMETVNIHADNVELAQTCYKRISDTLAGPIETGVIDLDPRVIEQLRTLGYID